MSTELTDPVVHERTVTEQRVDSIVMNMAAGQVEYVIGDYESSEASTPLESNRYSELFDNIAPGPAKDDFKDVLDNVRALARNRGQLGEGIDTDPIG